MLHSFPGGDSDGIKPKTKKWQERRREEKREDGSSKEEQEAKLLFSYVGQVPHRLGFERRKKQHESDPPFYLFLS